jgi:hypothetical protein
VLTRAGHEIDTVVEEGLTGSPDPDVVRAATAAGRLLITLDRGIGDVRTYPPGAHAGILVLRPADQSAASVLARAASCRRGPGRPRWHGCGRTARSASSSTVLTDGERNAIPASARFRDDRRAGDQRLGTVS